MASADCKRTEYSTLCGSMQAINMTFAGAVTCVTLFLVVMSTTNLPLLAGVDCRIIRY